MDTSNMIPVRVIHYRDFTVPVVFNKEDQQYYCEIDGEVINLGYYNTEFESDIKFIINRKLDLIYTFDQYPGTRLEWFQNGDDKRDIRLVYSDKRILKVFLVYKENEITEISLQQIKNESLKILEKIKKYYI